MDPFRGLAEFFLGRLEQKIVQSWVALVFQMVFSATVTYLFVAGTALTGGISEVKSKGAGMVMAALVLTVLFKSSKLTKGMMAVLPADEAKKEIDTNLQTISRT